MGNSFSNAFYQILMNSWDYLQVYRDQMALNVFSTSALRVFKSSEWLLENLAHCHSAVIASAALKAVLVLTENSWKHHQSHPLLSFHRSFYFNPFLTMSMWVWHTLENKWGGPFSKENPQSPYGGLISLWPRKPWVESFQIRIFFNIKEF